jgi:hypothetical protein
VDECLFGKATEPETLEHANAVPAQSRRIAWSAQCRLQMLALKGAAGETSSARAARLRERPDDVIADTDLRDIRTGCSHDSRDLVTQHHRCRHDVVRGEQEVRVTEA